MYMQDNLVMTHLVYSVRVFGNAQRLGVAKVGITSSIWSTILPNALGLGIFFQQFKKCGRMCSRCVWY
jgi:hypothetical protein